METLTAFRITGKKEVKSKVYYKIEWEEYSTSSKNQWVCKDDLNNCTALIHTFELSQLPKLEAAYLQCTLEQKSTRRKQAMTTLARNREDVVRINKESKGFKRNFLGQYKPSHLLVREKSKRMMASESNSDSDVEMEPVAALTAEELKGEANAAYKAQDYKEALALYTQAIDLDSTNATYFSNRAAASTMLRDYNSAISDCRRAVMIDGLFVKAYLRAAKCYVSIGNISEAVVQLVALEQLCRDNSKISANIQSVQRELKDTISVNALFQAALAYLEQSDYTNALYQIEQTFSLIEPAIMKHGSGASKFKSNALLNIPVALRVLRCQCLIGLKSYSEASLDTHNILHYEKRNSDALVLQAHIGYITDAYTLQQIQQLLSNSIGYDPDNKRCKIVLRYIKGLESLRLQGNAAFGSGEWVEADRIYTACVAADTEAGIFTVKALSNRATVRSKSGQYSAVVADCTQALDLLSSILFSSMEDISPEDMANSTQHALFHKLHLRRADAYIKQELYEECIRDYTTADGIKPGDASLRASLQNAQKLLKMSKRKDYYKIMGVERDASDAELKKAFRVLALKYHPDKQAGLSQEEKDISETRDVKEAYDVLTDSNKRHMFDQGHDVDGQSASGGHSHSHGGMDMDDMMAMFMAQQRQQSGGRQQQGFGGGGFSFDF